MAPMRREPSLSRRKPRAAATATPAGSLFLAGREGHFLLSVGLGTLAAGLQRERLMGARNIPFARARTANEGRGGE
jgi:hypothetical protein